MQEATAVAAVKLGMKSVLVLRSLKRPRSKATTLTIVGADVRFINAEDYALRRFEIMENIKKELEASGEKGYILPEGASNGIGLFGYINAMKEIQQQEDELGIRFDAVVSLRRLIRYIFRPSGRCKALQYEM